MNIRDLIDHCHQVQGSSDGRTWHPARPATAENTFLWLRIKAAWRVLLGKADAVDWG